jgi:hypothetical protein
MRILDAAIIWQRRRSALSHGQTVLYCPAPSLAGDLPALQACTRVTPVAPIDNGDDDDRWEDWPPDESAADEPTF